MSAEAKNRPALQAQTRSYAQPAIDELLPSVPSSSAERLDVKLRAADGRPASSGAPLAAHPIMPVQAARRRANSRRRSRLGRREKRRRTVNFNDELGRDLKHCIYGCTSRRALVKCTNA